MKGHEEIWPSAKQQGWRAEKLVWLLQPTREYANVKIRRQPLHAPSCSSWLSPPLVPATGRVVASVVKTTFLYAEAMRLDIC